LVFSDLFFSESRGTDQRGGWGETPMKMTFWGTRGSIAVPGRETVVYGGNTTCVEVVLKSGPRIIIDAGTGIRRLGESLGDSLASSPLFLLMTHVHWDHILGFPFFAPLLPSGMELRIDGHPNCMTGLRHTFATPMGGGFFPVRLEDIKAHLTFLDKAASGPLKVGEAEVESIPLRHPQGGLGFRIREEGRTLVFVTDNELDSEETVRRYADFCKGADILVHDAQYFPEETAERKGWGHSDYESVVRLAGLAGVARVFLFHHDPSRTDSEVKAVELRCRDLIRRYGWGMNIEAAREDSSIEI
jgi:phosphoribosyl 1,2-cyclic phosphodiesterase